MYRLFEILSFLFCFLTILKIKTQNEFFKWYYLAPPMFVAAIFIHPGLNSQSLYDIAWTYALYLEAVALLPQIHLFTKRGILIEKCRGNHWVPHIQLRYHTIPEQDHLTSILVPHLRRTQQRIRRHHNQCSPLPLRILCPRSTSVIHRNILFRSLAHDSRLRDQISPKLVERNTFGDASTLR